MNRKLAIVSLLAVALTWVGAVGATSVPNCQKVAPHERNLTKVRTAEVKVSAFPFGVVYARRKNIAFVAVERHLDVLDTSAFTPKLIHKIPLPLPRGFEYEASGIALTHDGRYVLVTTEGTSLIVVDARSAAIGSPKAVVGILKGTTRHGAGAIQVTVTKDDKYAFVSQEVGSSKTHGRGTINVFKLQLANAHRPVSGTYIGYLVLNYNVVGLTLSPDGSNLYVTSENTTIDSTHGTLSVINAEKLKTRPSTALISSVNAGCGPVRVIASQDSKVVWVTARESNHLLAFNAAKLLSKPSEALLASVQVGTSPVDLIFARNESRILIANSNRFGYPHATAGLSVVDVKAALRGESAVFGQLPTAMFPREFAISPNGRTILATDFNSSLVQAIGVASLP